MEKYIWFDGLKFARDEKTGYYLNSTIRKRLHRYVWEFYNGTIPNGYHVHHKDHNKDNNDIANLELLSASKHEKHHAKMSQANEKLMEWKRNNLSVNARPKASEWHKSEEGRKWHSKHGKEIYKNRKEIEFICEYCGNKYLQKTNGVNRFCSNKCKSAWRRKEGLDNEIRTCACCGGKFNINKYSKTKCCSKSCVAKFFNISKNLGGGS